MPGTQSQSATTLNQLEVLEDIRSSLTRSHSTYHLERNMLDQQRNMQRQTSVEGTGIICERHEDKNQEEVVEIKKGIGPLIAVTNDLTEVEDKGLVHDRTRTFDLGPKINSESLQSSSTRVFHNKSSFKPKTSVANHRGASYSPFVAYTSVSSRLGKGVNQPGPQTSRASVSDNPCLDLRNGPTSLVSLDSTHDNSAPLDLSMYDDAAWSAALMQEVLVNRGSVHEKTSCTVSAVKDDSVMINRLDYGQPCKVIDQNAFAKYPTQVPPVQQIERSEHTTLSGKNPMRKTLANAKKVKKILTTEEKARLDKGKADLDARAEQEMHKEWHEMQKNFTVKRKAGEQSEIDARKKRSIYALTSTDALPNNKTMVEGKEEHATLELEQRSDSKSLAQIGEEDEKKVTHIVGKWAEVRPQNASSSLGQISTAEAEALLEKQLQDAENKKVHTGTLSAKDLKYYESSQKALSHDFLGRKSEKRASRLHNHRRNNNLDQPGNHVKPPVVTSSRLGIATPERREAEQKSQEKYVKQREHEHAEVSDSGRSTSGTPCAEIVHETDYNPSSRGFAALQGHSATERPWKAAALPQTNSRRVRDAEHRGRGDKCQSRRRVKDAQKAKKSHPEPSEGTETTPLSREEKRRVAGRKQHDTHERRREERIAELKASIAKFDHPQPHEPKSPAPYEQDNDVTCPDAEHSALPNVYESSVSSDEDEDEEQYRERQRLKRTKLLQPPTAAHEDVPALLHSPRPTFAGKGIARKTVPSALIVRREPSISDEDVSYQRPTVSGKEIPRKTVPPPVQANQSLSDEDVPDDPEDHDDARSTASSATITSIDAHTNTDPHYLYHVTRTTTTSPTPTTYGPFPTLSEANTTAHHHLLPSPSHFSPTHTGSWTSDASGCQTWTYTSPTFSVSCAVSKASARNASLPHSAASLPRKVYAVYEKVVEERGVGVRVSFVQRCLGCWTERQMANESAGRAWVVVKGKGKGKGAAGIPEEHADKRHLFRKSESFEREGVRVEVEVWVEETEVWGPRT